MLKNYFILFLLLALFACKKNDDEGGSAKPVAALSFKANGVMHSYSGDWDVSTLTGCAVDSLYTSSLGYFILAGVAAQNSNGFEARIHASTVSPGNYYTVDFEAYLAGVHYLVSSDCVVNINRIENGRARGSFSGKIAQSSSSSWINITEGIFTDLPIR